MKVKRHNAIVGIIKNNQIETQAELAAHLNERGFEVTQATVSRDIKDLGLTKVPTATGKYIYALLSEGKDIVSNNRNTVLKESFISIDKANNLIVLKTLPGMAQAAAFVLDAIEDNDKIGSIAGDDTVMIICRSNEAAIKIINEIIKMVK